MRSQDVLHSAYMPFLEQMNCVPGMVTQFAFTLYTTEEYRDLPYMVEKVANINPSC
jgi:cytochrome c oxidase subunit 2